MERDNISLLKKWWGTCFVLQNARNTQRTNWQLLSSGTFIRSVQTRCRVTVPNLSGKQEKMPANFSRQNKLVPDAETPSMEDVKHLYQFFDQSTKLVVLTGAGMSTECGIPDHRSPNGAYSSGFKPITHQEFLRSSRARKRYWARSYAGWRRFTAAQPGTAYVALASLEKAGRINFITTQNVGSRAGGRPAPVSGTIAEKYQKENREMWVAAIESLDHGSPGLDESFGMKQRLDGDIEIDEKFWEDFQIPPPKIFVLKSFFAHEAGAATAIVNIGATRADDLVPLKINARIGDCCFISNIIIHILNFIQSFYTH
ncbi:hypothetical protein UlMin_011017 [Ulmus minor]